MFTPIDLTGPDPQHLGNDDLGDFDPTLFYDTDLVNASPTATTLLETAFNLKFASSSPVRLRGLHSLLFEDEVAIVALPDATQRKWKAVDTHQKFDSPPFVPTPAPDYSAFADCDDTQVPVTPSVPPAAVPDSVKLPLSDPPDAYQVATLLDLLETHKAMLTFCQARADVLGIVTLPSHFRTADCLDWQTRFRGGFHLPPRPTLSDNLRGMADLSYVAVYHPWLQMADPQEPDGLSTVPPDGAVCGLLAARERARGVWVAAGNLAVANVLGLKPVLPPADLPDLFDRRFNLFRQQADDFRIVSAHTLGDGQELLQVSVRRLMMLLRKVALLRGMEYVFRNNDRILAEAVRAGFLALLRDLFQRGAFAGDTPQESYRVFTGVDVNPRQSVDLGQFIAVIQVAPSQPLEFINVTLVRQPDGNLQATVG